MIDIHVQEKDIQFEFKLIEKDEYGWVARAAVTFGAFGTTIGWGIKESDAPTPYLSPSGKYLWVGTPCFPGLYGANRKLIHLNKSFEEEFKSLLIDGYYAELKKKETLPDDIPF